MARYYTPSDTNIDKIGIPPDREVLFPVLNEEGEKQYSELIKSDEIAKYVELHKNMSEQAISAYGLTLKKKYPDIDVGSLKKLIRTEVNRTKGTMLYDLDYDIQLNAALDILALPSSEYASLLKNTKTLKELQDEAAKAEEITDGKK